LLGQNVNNYGKRFSDPNAKKVDFTDLLEMISEIDEVKRIRFTSPHPLHMDDRFLEVFAKNPKICKSMHMPLQSGSTKVLRDMKRGYTKEWFLNRALKLRDLVKDVHISTDIIVAFPGESEEDFEETLDVIKKVEFEQIFSFKYSPRPLTKAAEFENQIDSKTASIRLSKVQKLHDEILDRKIPKEVGKIYEVYFEELKSKGRVGGRSDNNFLVLVEGSEELLGKFKKVKITKASRHSLFGEIVE